MSPKSKASDRRLYPKPWDPFSLVLDRLRGELERHLGLQPATTKAAATVLDFGCGDKPYAPLALKAGFQKYVGADIAENGAADVHVREDGTVPLPDGSVDAILSTQVLEHVGDPAAVGERLL